MTGDDLGGNAAPNAGVAPVIPERDTPPPAGAELVRYDAMCRAIADAHAVDEVKAIRDKALAFETYSRLARNIEAESLAAAIRLRAERKVGKMLEQMSKSLGGQPKKNSGQPVRSSFAVAKEAGAISDKQAQRWQKLAGVPEETFEAALAAPGKPSTTGIIRSVEPARPARPARSAPRPQRIDPQALWVWGRLAQFEDDGILARPPADLLESMTPEMRADVQRMAPFVAEWLLELAGIPAAVA